MTRCNELLTQGENVLKKEAKDKNKIPTLLAETTEPWRKSDDGSLFCTVVQTWCPFCADFHLHGMYSDAMLNDHRIAHCDNYPNGYFLRLNDKDRKKALAFFKKA